MSHLGRRLSALIDGELGGADRDRVHAHLARCLACRAEAKELRALKRRMSALRDVVADDALTRRLVAIAEPGDPVPPRRRARRRRPIRPSARSGRPDGRAPPVTGGAGAGTSRSASHPVSRSGWV
jgi:anti-sigma factor RsiW